MIACILLRSFKWLKAVDLEVDFKHQSAERFLGVLRAHFPSSLKQMVSLELAKDYTQLGVDEIRSHL